MLDLCDITRCANDGNGRGTQRFQRELTPGGGALRYIGVHMREQKTHKRGVFFQYDT